MGFLFSGFFWGGVLILFGVSLILNVAFGVRIPFARIFFALLFIYIGLSILFGSRLRHRRHLKATAFGSAAVSNIKPHDKYDFVFGTGDVDLRNVVLQDSVFKVEVNTVFGNTEVKLNPGIPTRVITNSAFGEARTPDGNSVAFGQHTYQNKCFSDTAGYLLVNASVVFGRVEVLEP